MKYKYEDYSCIEEFDEEYKFDLKLKAAKMVELRKERDELNWKWKEADDALKDPNKSPKKYIRRKENYEKRYNDIVVEYEAIYKEYVKLTKEWKIAKIGAVEYYKELDEEHQKRLAKLTKERMIFDFEHKYKCSYESYKKMEETYGKQEAWKMIQGMMKE